MALILVTGGTGFVGRRLVKALIAQGHELCCLVRPTSQTSALAHLGVRFYRGDVTDPDSVERAVAGAEAVIHLAAIIRERGKATFHRTNYEGTRNVVGAAVRTGAKRLLFMSNLGAAPDPAFPFLHSKWQAEEAIKASGLDYTIFRSSVLFGEGDGFVSPLAGLIKRLPLVPVIGSGQTRFQLLSVDEVVTCLIMALGDDKTIGQVMELGGPEHLTYEEIVDLIMGVLGRRRPKVHIPVTLMQPLAWLMDKLLPRPLVTPGQLAMLRRDNITDLDVVERAFGFKPISLRQGLDYIVR
ncbi:MAG TPA: complex I NDUFA9 subunit family protein [Dehalococcoidia bacterium]|nr:complex I NDUFA9 subunit family protein [Dehalococcoidia bacterium]